MVFFLRSMIGPENSRDSLNQSANQNEIATCLVENCSNMALCFIFLKWIFKEMTATRRTHHSAFPPGEFFVILCNSHNTSR